MPAYSLYTLHEPTGELRYIGITSVNLQKRLQRHLDKVHDHSHRCNWLAKLKRQAVRPQIKLLGKAPDHITACLLERFLIATGRYLEFDLVNSSGGGDGVYFPTEETRRKMSEAMKRRFMNPEIRKHNQEIQKVAQMRPEVREKKRLAASKPEALAKVQAVKQTQDWKDKHHAGVLAAQDKITKALRASVTPEFRAIIGKLSAARWADPAYRERVTAAIRASNPGRPRMKDACISG